VAVERGLHAHHDFGGRSAIGHHGQPDQQLRHPQRQRQSGRTGHEPLGAEIEQYATCDDFEPVGHCALLFQPWPLAHTVAEVLTLLQDHGVLRGGAGKAVGGGGTAG